jgi:hypothetical protein
MNLDAVVLCDVTNHPDGAIDGAEGGFTML